RLTLGKGQRRYQTDVEAYQLYLRARTLVVLNGPSNVEAIRLFEQVIARDPSFAPAHAGLADAYAAMSWSTIGDASMSLEEGLTGMRQAAIRALELDPLLAEAHAAIGVTYARELEWENAAKSFERAIELNPNLPQIPVSYSHSLMETGQTEKALQLLSAAMISDPFSLQVRRSLATAQFVAGHYDEAIANWRQILAADPDYPNANQVLARALTFAGRPVDAIAVWENLRDRPANEPRPGLGWERWLTPAYVMAGRRKDVDRLIAAHKNEHPYRQALIYAALGDKNRTFAALNRAVDLVPHRVAFTLVCPEMRLLRGDPRLDALRKRLNLR
ncbi:MAG TPA: tetratricopeptide repeat protein, partial [Vicinamibacterales bacterium]|nr:tetratricopeptide repeat protein [Vicinamibacterales bacterium]